MSLPNPVQFKGVPGSPYTRKMLALLRYRHIPYALLVGNQALADEPLGARLPKPRVDLLPTFYLPNADGEMEAVVDSTPLIRRFEHEAKGRSAIPDDPVLGFLNYLIEDYGDEWLTKAMFHYRWYYDDDIQMAGRILPRWTNINKTEEELNALGSFFADRQINRLYVVGSNDITAPVIEASYRRFLSLFDRVIERQTFLFGARPSSADFALYAQLTQLATFDPTPAAICLRDAPRVYAWVDLVDDLSGHPGDESAWLDRNEIRDVLGDFLVEIGRVYVPVLLANAEAMASGDKDMRTTVDGQPWEQPTFPYQGRCLQWIREQYAALIDSDRAAVNEILAGSGCEALLAGL